jgi:MYXO-CTERM domain-containing protein
MSLSTSRTTASLLLSSFVILSACGVGPEPTPEVFGQQRAPIVNGEFDEGHPAVGALLSQGLCTASLVGDRTILTAAHCVTPEQRHTFVLGEQRIEVDRLTRHPEYSDFGAIRNDVAVGLLRRQPTGITPARLGVFAPELGDKVTLVGLGQTSNGGGSGFKRKAVNIVWGKTNLTLTYRGAAGESGNLCYGDSGGPSFALINGQDVQVGVHSYGVGVCGQQATDMRVDAYLDWIRKTAEGDIVEGGRPDTTLPTVSISSPASGATIFPATPIVVEAADDNGISAVTLRVGGVDKETKTSPPYTFELELPPGKQTVTAVAADVAQNTAEASVTVTVREAGAFGDRCDDDAGCSSGFCALHGDSGVRFCSQACTPGGTDCPVDSTCGQLQQRVGCSPPAGSLARQSGCATGPGAPARRWPWALSLLAVGLVLLRQRRR